ncbi:hypothetical protein Q8F55_008190 [Vanrija albida]|uniref:Uncharacterized protein n=1 Tax=Vanrija albida TaxID=181172 RepID=A0ABR3PVX9_9TREE
MVALAALVLSVLAVTAIAQSELNTTSNLHTVSEGVTAHNATGLGGHPLVPPTPPSLGSPIESSTSPTTNASSPLGKTPSGFHSAATPTRLCAAGLLALAVLATAAMI